jgi:hypothetical protein
VAHDDAVFTREGDDVGNGGDGDQFEKRFEDSVKAGFGPAGAGQDGVSEFEGDSGAAEVGVRVIAIGATGVDDGEGRGEGGFGEVVVCDDDVDIEFAGAADGGFGADAVIDADDETDAAGGGFVDGRRLEAVTVEEAVLGQPTSAPGWASSRAFLRTTVEVTPSTS